MVLTPLSATSIRLNWTDNSVNETSFAIYRKDPGQTNFALAGSTGVNATSFTDNGLSVCQTYEYYVRANNINGGENSTTASAQSLCEGPDAPSNLVITETECTSVSMLWQDNSTTEAGFVIIRNGIIIDTVNTNVTALPITVLQSKQNTITWFMPII
ncbi:MAG: fibronectin type III domain-containing protein [Bacteroidales bacterium]|nr:fibronectin type III domain-containing protein [Bacteroidales bacterium]